MNVVLTFQYYIYPPHEITCQRIRGYLLVIYSRNRYRATLFVDDCSCSPAG